MNDEPINEHCDASDAPDKLVKLIEEVSVMRVAFEELSHRVDRLEREFRNHPKPQLRFSIRRTASAILLVGSLLVVTVAMVLYGLAVGLF